MNVSSDVGRYPCSKCYGTGSFILFTTRRICSECHGRGWHAVPTISVDSVDDPVADPGPHPLNESTLAAEWQSARYEVEQQFDRYSRDCKFILGDILLSWYR